MQSGVMAFASPRMIKHHRDGNVQDFHHEARQTSRQIALGAGMVALGLGIAVPLIGTLFGRPALVANTGTFWLMLLATWMRANSETFSNILAARHQDRAVWMGNLLFLIPALSGNLVFVPLLGFKGVGLSAIVASAFILFWRWKHIRSYTPVRHA
jgi:O-antigen/teichoic acid export membrane protein